MYCHDNGMHEALPPSLYDLDSCFIVIRVALFEPGQRSGFSDSIIIIFINCNWVVTRWQWLFYMYTKHENGYY